MKRTDEEIAELARNRTEGLRQRKGDQVLPEGNEHPVAHEMVSADLMDRLAVGVSRYGQPLQPFNGRDTLQDAYEEVLDLAVYLRSLRYAATAKREALIREVEGVVRAQADAPPALLAQKIVDHLLGAGAFGGES